MKVLFFPLLAATLAACVPSPRDPLPPGPFRMPGTPAPVTPSTTPAPDAGTLPGTPDFAQTPDTTASANPEAEAFARYDARLGLTDARVSYDDAGCALYTATGTDGQPYREAMLTPGGESICTN